VDWLSWLIINSRAVTILASAAVVVVTAIDAYVDSGADLDGQSPSHTCVPVEPSADPHGVPTHCDGAADRRGGVGQGPDAAILSYDFISYRHRWYWSRRKATTVMAQSYEFIIHADLRLRPDILCAEL
jgi:hypothetical protein